jgi:2-amino-4-hydroxy-6-hydroxymethyldihydropteridine diphosphokinase
MLAPVVIACIALGANLDDRAANLRAALERIDKLPQTHVLAVSSFHETEPVDAAPGSGSFMNAAAVLETELQPADLMKALLDIEKSLGRDRSLSQPRNSPRPIDLDLLLYNDLILSTPQLTLPHPRMHLRRFVLEPLAEIAPTLIHPVRGQSIRDLLAALNSPKGEP